MEPTGILALTTVNSTAALKEAVGAVRRRLGDVIRVDKIYFDDYEHPDADLAPLAESIRRSRVILVDVRGDVRVARELPGLLASYEGTVVVLVAGSQKLFALTRMGAFRGDMIFKPGREREFNVHRYVRARRFAGLTKALGKVLPFGPVQDMRRWVLAQEYYMEGDAWNLEQLLLLLLKHYGGAASIGRVPSPRRQPPYGLTMPGRGPCRSLRELRTAAGHDPARPSVGIFMYGGMHFHETRPLVDALWDNLKDHVNLVPLFAQVEHNLEAIEKYFKGIDLIINLQYFRLHGGPYGGEPEPALALLRKLDAPLLGPLRSFERDVDRWRESSRGLSPIETVLAVTLPELDGAVEPLFLAGMQASEDADLGRIKETRVLTRRVEKLGRRVRRWLALRRMPNREKRIALLTYSYPPGEDNLASAGYLDVFASLRVFLERLAEGGYDVRLPEEDLRELFLSSGMVNSPKYLARSGIRIPAALYASWFEKLPAAVRRAVTARWGEPPGSVMVEGDDILVPGLELGRLFLGVQPSRGAHEDADGAYHDRGLPPHHQYLAFYAWLEHVFRADAVVHFGMHGTLEFMPGKELALSDECFPDLLIGSLPHLYYYWIGNPSEATIAKRRSCALCISHASPLMKAGGLYDRYLELEDLLNQHEQDPCEESRNLICGTASALHLDPDPTLLRRELYRMRRRLIPLGLHVMDRGPGPERMPDFLHSLLRIDREFPSINRLVARRAGLEWDAVRDAPGAQEIEDEARRVIALILEGRAPGWLPRGYGAWAAGLAERAASPAESRGLLRALEGRYIEAARAGDPLRDPDVYPSGRAMVAFDPRLIPTAAAEARGKRAAELIAQSFRRSHGRWPETVGLVLWGFETMKTGGDGIAAVLALMGIRIVRGPNLWFKELEAVPLEELGRPRIDVLVTICGIFRDTFGTHLELLERAVNLAAGLDEPSSSNFVRRHHQEKRGELGDLALARIFGPGPSEYATRMLTLVETGSWKEEQDLVRSYDDSMSYAYFKGGAVRSREALAGLMAGVDVVAQERDNTEYEVTDLDHYYEFLGGLARSVQDKKGERAQVLVIDATDEELEADSLETAVERSVRTRTLNPRWIEGMLSHDFHGAKQIKDRVQHLLGFAATTDAVRSWIFDEVAGTYLFDEAMRARLQDNNPYAALEIAQTLMETHRRGYWETDDEKIRRLRDIILSLEGDVE